MSEDVNARLAQAQADGVAGRACECEPADPPTFDEEAAKSLDSWEIKRRWPRKQTVCVKCGASMIAYASFMHYIAGDW